MTGFILALLIPTILQATPIRVAILDTGIKLEYLNKIKLCNNGLIDLTNIGITDENGHGTNIAGIISDGLKDIDYCLILINYWIRDDDRGNYLRSKESFIWISKNRKDIDIVVMAGGGTKGDWSEEYRIKDLLDEGIVMIFAAGNQAKNLDDDCSYYPACYDKRAIVVGNGDPVKKTLYKTTNYGSIVDIYADGLNKCGFGICFGGTSQATAIISRLFILKFDEIKKDLKIKELNKWRKKHKNKK